MPLSIDRQSEDELSVLFDEDFVKSVTEYLGIDKDTPSEDMPINVSELLEEAVNSCEQEQWRFILKKDVILQLPPSAFCEWDGMLFLPLGIADEVTITYNDLDETIQTFTDFTLYTAEPMKLYSANWNTLVNDCFDEPFPISVSYRPGYTSFADIPKSTIRALKILVAHSFESQGQDLPIPAAYRHNRDLGWLNNDRANKFIVYNDMSR
jgi:hypothetical protein